MVRPALAFLLSLLLVTAAEIPPNLDVEGVPPNPPELRAPVSYTHLTLPTNREV